MADIVLLGFLLAVIQEQERTIATMAEIITGIVDDLNGLDTELDAIEAEFRTSGI